MLLKDPHNQADFFSRLNIRSRFSKGRVKGLFVAAAAVAIFGAGILFQRTGTIGKVIVPAIEKVIYSVSYMQGMMSEPQKLFIDISFKNYQKLAYNRKLALERDMLLPQSRDEVPADLRIGDKTVKVKLRLKGDMSDHWKDNYKWSFRIRARGENTIFGMKQFSIQHPATRGYLNEWVLHKLLKQEDFIALRYDFVEVIVNGRNQGIYALEEHFEKRLIENNKRREGPIIRWDDHLKWAGGHIPGSIGSNDAFTQAPIDAFQSGKVRESEEYRNLFLQAKDLLESFRLEKLSVEQVFDSDKMAMLFAITDLFGYQHALLDGQVRFYYNPVTALLEPIGYDQQTIRDVRLSLLEGEEMELTNRNLNYWIALFFKDADFYARYVRALTKIADPEYLDSFFEEIEPEMSETMAILHKDFPAYKFNNKYLLYRNQQYIRKVLEPIIGIRAYFDRTDATSLAIELSNIHSLPIEVMGATYQDSIRFPLEEKLLLPPKERLASPSFQTTKFSIPSSLTWSDSLADGLRVSYRVVGTDSIRNESVFPWAHLTALFQQTDFIRQPPNPEKFEFITIDHKAGQIMIHPGSWQLTEDLIIPADYVLTCYENTRLDLSGGATILSYSPLRFRGSQDAPIVITSADSTGQGLVVLKAGTESSLEWVVFDNLSHPSKGRWKLTGAVTFYESPVKIVDCQFSDNRSEDGLNIFRSDFSMNRTVFKNTMSDAFDGDFVTGRINNSRFINCGNDAIDVSGSLLEISNVYIEGAGDKGLSIGENSKATVRGIEINSSEIALASKDLSELVLYDVTLTDCTVGFTVFKKKPEFGPASITVTGLTINQVEVPWVIEEQSTAVADGKLIPSNQSSVEDILYGIQYGKSSK